MSDELDQGTEPGVGVGLQEDEPRGPAVSLEDRMAERRDEIEAQVTELFEVPRFEGILSVELRVVGWKKLRALAQRHQRQRDEATKELYSAADQLLYATVGFHEDQETDDGVKHRSVEKTWPSLLAGVQRARREPVSDELSSRAALIRLLGDTQVMFLWNEWQEWMKGERRSSDSEVSRDFPTTP